VVIPIEPAYCGCCMGSWMCKATYRSVSAGSSLFLTLCTTFITQTN